MTVPDWRRLPSLSALRAFEATARLDGFSQAARALNVTHAAVAQQVRSLESELGVSLANRSGRGLALTDEGRRLAQALGDGFGTIAAAVETARRTEARRGLRVAATPVFTQALLLPRLAQFWAQHPDVPVSVNPSYDLIDLARDGYDVAIRSGSDAASWSGHDSEVLLWAQYILVAAPSLMAHSSDLGKLPWIGPLDRHERQMLRDSGIDPDFLTVNSVDTHVLCVPSAMQGLGLLYTPDALVRDDIAAGRLVQVPFRELPRFAYYLVTLPGPRRPAVQAFTDWLRTLVRGKEHPAAPVGTAGTGRSASD